MYNYDTIPNVILPWSYISENVTTAAKVFLIQRLWE